MLIHLNGEKKDIPDGLTVSGLLQHLEIKPERVAVEINEEIVRKATYASVPVRDGDRVEVVQFMGGGASSAECEVLSAEWEMQTGRQAAKGRLIFLKGQPDVVALTDGRPRRAAPCQTKSICFVEVVQQ